MYFLKQVKVKETLGHDKSPSLLTSGDFVIVTLKVNISK